MKLQGLHATPIKNSKRIAKQGLKPQPFWKSREPLRFPLKFKFKYHSHANLLSGRTHAEMRDAVYDSLKAATIHLTGSSRKKFDLDKLQLYIVDFKKSKIIGENKKAFFVRTGVGKKYGKFGEKIVEVKLESEPQALTPFELTVPEKVYIHEKTRELNWFEANNKIAEYITKKIQERGLN